MRKFIVALVILAILEISLSLYLTAWREAFWQTVSLKQPDGFLHQLGVFTVIALFLCATSGYTIYICNRLAISWRERLNKKALTMKSSKIENISQRIQADCMDYPDLMISICFGLGKAVCYVVVFAVSLIWVFHWYYLVLLFGYSVAGTLLAKKIALPLINLNYQSQRAEASYRLDLKDKSFKECISLMLSIALRQKYVSYFQSFYGQLAVVIPLIIIAPVYFTTGMTLGALMRFNGTANTILDNLSYGVSSFSSINRLLSCRKRLKEIGVI